MRVLKTSELQQVSGGFNLLTDPLRLAMVSLDAIAVGSKAFGTMLQAGATWLGKVVNILFH